MPQPSLSTYHPSLGERLQQGISGLLGKVVNQRLANHLGERLFTAINDLTPVGNATMSADAGTAIRNGHPVKGAGMGTWAILPVPKAAKKVVGTVGRGMFGAAPKVIRAYHGTGANLEHIHFGNRASGAREGPLGFWSTDNPQVASQFAEWNVRGNPNVVPVDLEFENALRVGSYDDIRDLVDRFTQFERPGYQMGGRNIRMMNDKVDYNAAREHLRGQGHDGIILENTMMDSPDGATPINQYLSIDPRKIRAALTGETLWKGR